jgi:hypothetical protein
MTRSLTPPTSLAHTHPSNMTFISSDPSFWPIINLQLFYSYWTGLSHQSVMSRSNIDLHFCSCRRRPGGIWLGWDGRCSEPAAILMISPVLTIGQEVGWPCCPSNQVAKNGVIDWTDLGEWRSLIRKPGEYNEFATEATLVSHDCAVFDCSYLILNYSVVGELRWLQNVLDTLYWNPICCVCIKAKNWCCTNSSSLTISATVLGMSHMHCVRFFWLAAHRNFTIGLADRYSESSATISFLSN